MAKRRVKRRTHVPVTGKGSAKNGAAAMNQSPKSMVIRIGAGEVGSSVSQLVKDVRLMMEPDTASRLKVNSRIESVFFCSSANNFNKRNEKPTNSKTTQRWLVHWGLHICFYSLKRRLEIRICD